MKIATAVSVLLLCFSTGIPRLCRAQDTPSESPLSVSVQNDGQITVKLDGKIVADGIWSLQYFPPQPADPGQLPLIQNSVKVSRVSDQHFIVTRSYQNASAATDIAIDGEDLHLLTHLQNLDPFRTISQVNFSGLTFHFAHSAQGTLASFHWTYLAAHGSTIFHPSVAEPIGSVCARDEHFGFGVYSASEFDRKCLFNAVWQKDGIIPADCTVELHTQRQVSPQNSIDVDANFRISTDTRDANLLAAYKKIYDEHFPRLLYHPDKRPVAANTRVGDQRTITPINPCGFLGPLTRFDSANGTSVYVRVVAPALKRVNAQGVIIWSPGGFRPPMYPPDFDVFPPVVQRNIPALVSGFHRFGLHLGLCARCGDDVIRAPGQDPVVYRLSADNPQNMALLLARFRHVMDMGFDLFYLDSFGADNPNDQQILAQIRSAVGPDVQLFTEKGTDMSLPYAGRYCEWWGDSPSWVTLEQYAQLRFLCPDSVWICINKNGPIVRPEFSKLGLVPLVDDVRSNRLPASRPAN